MREVVHWADAEAASRKKKRERMSHDAPKRGIMASVKSFPHFKLKMNAFTSANSWGFKMRFIGGMGLIGVAV